MDRQGFAMLVNKFTGDEATIFTYKYTKAFEEMENEIKQLKQDIKVIGEIALSDKEQKQRLLEMNQHDFSERTVQKRFANCVDYEQYKNLYERFITYIKPMSATDRVLKMGYAIKGMEKLRVNLLIANVANAGNSMNIDTDIKDMLRQIDKINNKSLGGEKSVKTKYIKGLENKIDTINTQLENSIIYPDKSKFVTLKVHGFSNNYMYKHNTPYPIKTDEYVKWINKFPRLQMPTKESWNVDWTKPVELFIHYVAIPNFDHMNCDKSIIDQIIQRVYGENDNIVHKVHSERVGVCEKFWDGTISIYIKNVSTLKNI